MEKISFHGEYITLGQFLKMADCISTGGMAKPFLMENEVFVNGVLEQRRGRKLYAGDQIKVSSLEFKIVSEEQL